MRCIIGETMRDAAWGGADLSALMHHAKTTVTPISEGRIVGTGCSARDKRVPMQCFA